MKLTKDGVEHRLRIKDFDNSKIGSKQERLLGPMCFMYFANLIESLNLNTQENKTKMAVDMIINLLSYSEIIRED